jgi:hypothetical protein
VHSLADNKTHKEADMKLQEKKPRVRELIDEIEKTVKSLTEQITTMRAATEIDEITLECAYMGVDLPIMLTDVKALRDYLV